MILNCNYHVFGYKMFKELVEHKSEFAVFVEFSLTNSIAFGADISHLFDEDGLSLLL